jgi:hypothetical protein
MKRLFVGGYLHGKVADLPKAVTEYQVVVPPRKAFLDLDACPWCQDMTVDRYELREVTIDGMRLKVFVVEGAVPITGFYSALIYAAGLDETGTRRE